jgi:hypothetical protein
MPVRGLLSDAGVSFENNQEHLALSALLERLESAAQRSGGEPPAPRAGTISNIATHKGLSGNDLLAALATHAQELRDKVKAWKAAEQKIAARQPNWRLAERPVRLGAKDQEADLENIRAGRCLLGDPDPVPPVVSAASEALRAKLNSAHAAWETAWKKGEERLGGDATWAKLTPEQKHGKTAGC